MVHRRYWQVNQLQKLFAHHPLMIHLVQSLVWRIYDTSDKVIHPFRITEDKSYATIEDTDCTIDPNAPVGIIHPLQLTTEKRSARGNLLNDYEILQSFPQIGRPLYFLKPGEEEQTEIVRFADIKVEAIALVSFLDRKGWSRGNTQGGGVFCEYSKSFKQANITAFIEHNGVPIYAVVDGEMQSIQRCFFLSGVDHGDRYPNLKLALPLNPIDPIVLSEVLADVEAIAAKSK